MKKTLFFLFAIFSLAVAIPVFAGAGSVDFIVTGKGSDYITVQAQVFSITNKWLDLALNPEAIQVEPGYYTSHFTSNVIEETPDTWNTSFSPKVEYTLPNLIPGLNTFHIFTTPEDIGIPIYNQFPYGTYTYNFIPEKTNWPDFTIQAYKRQMKKKNILYIAIRNKGTASYSGPLTYWYNFGSQAPSGYWSDAQEYAWLKTNTTDLPSNADANGTTIFEKTINVTNLKPGHVVFDTISLPSTIHPTTYYFLVNSDFGAVELDLNNNQGSITVK